MRYSQYYFYLSLICGEINKQRFYFKVELLFFKIKVIEKRFSRILYIVIKFSLWYNILAKINIKGEKNGKKIRIPF